MSLESEKFKLFVDDMREIPKGWFGARTVSDTIKFLAAFSPINAISLDHDILFPVTGPDKGCFYSAETYMGVAYYIAALPSEKRPHSIRIHSSNTGAAMEMARVMGLNFNDVYALYHPEDYSNA